MIARITCLIIGYIFGNILTAEVVTRKITGKPCRELGATGNPGMANVMENLGFKPGIIVLAGDIGKTVIASLICALLFRNTIGSLAVLYAGTGATLGHNFPVWQHFRGGKGVATTCACIFLTSPGFGLVSMIAGMLTVFATQYLCVGGVVIPAVFTLLMVLFGSVEASLVSLFLTVLMFQRHWSKLRLVPFGKCEKSDVLGAIRRKITRK